jgi:amino acid transporter
MESLLELLRVSMQPINVPFTILLVLVVLYWLFVCIGFLGSEAFDADMDAHAGGDGAHHFHALHSVMKFLHVGEAPLMAILSVLVLCAWAFSVLINYYLNASGSLSVGLLLLIPNLLLSLLLTRLLTKPLRAVFKMLNKDYDTPVKIIGQVCVVTTGEANATFGQASVEVRGAPLLLQVRTSGEEVLRRGERALIISEDTEKNCFHVIKYQEPKIED